MPSFVTPPGIARAAHILRPFSTPYGNVWFVDLTFEISGSDTATNQPLMSLWRFGVLSAPTIHDNSTGKIPVSSGVEGTGSATGVSDDIGVTPVVGRGDARCSTERWHRAAHKVRPEHQTLHCEVRWPHAAIKVESGLVISRRCENEVRGTWASGLSC
jgi:hypothetical protein